MRKILKNSVLVLSLVAALSTSVFANPKDKADKSADSVDETSVTSRVGESTTPCEGASDRTSVTGTSAADRSSGKHSSTGSKAE